MRDPAHNRFCPHPARPSPNPSRDSVRTLSISRIDFIVVLFSLLDYVPGMGNFTSIRTVRLLRPLRAINKIEGMKVSCHSPCIPIVIPRPHSLDVQRHSRPASATL